MWLALHLWQVWYAAGEQPEIVEEPESVEKPDIVERSDSVEKPDIIERSKSVEKPDIVKKTKFFARFVRCERG